MKGDAIRVAKIDVDKYLELANQYKIQSIPTLMLFKNGEVLWKHTGVMHARELKEVIEKYE